MKLLRLTIGDLVGILATLALIVALFLFRGPYYAIRFLFPRRKQARTERGCGESASPPAAHKPAPKPQSKSKSNSASHGAKIYALPAPPSPHGRGTEGEGSSITVHNNWLQN